MPVKWKRRKAKCAPSSDNRSIFRPVQQTHGANGKLLCMSDKKRSKISAKNNNFTESTLYTALHASILPYSYNANSNINPLINQLLTWIVKVLLLPRWMAVNQLRACCTQTCSFQIWFKWFEYKILVDGVHQNTNCAWNTVLNHGRLTV